MRHFLILGVTVIALAACTPDNGAPPTPTKTPAAQLTPTSTIVYPSLDEVRQSTLHVEDLLSGFSSDPEFTGPLTADILIERSSAETGAYLQELDNIYGYQSGFIRSGSRDEFAAIRNWVIVFRDSAQASRFMTLHPTIIAGEQGFQSVAMPAFGEESAVYRATSPAEEGARPERHDVLMRHKNIVAVITLVKLLGYTDLAELELYARTLDSRLSQMANP